MKEFEQNNEISERISTIKAYFFKNNNRFFAKSIDISETTLSSICNGKKSPGAGVLNAILEAAPEVNRSWLFFGDGEMLNPGAIQHNSGNQNCTITNVDNSTTATEEVTELRSQLKSANETIHALTSMLSTKVTELQHSVDLINQRLNED